MEEILPIISHSGRNCEVRPHPVIVLEESADHRLQKNDMPVTLLLNERVRLRELIFLQRREVVRAPRVGSIRLAPPADVGHIDSRSDVVLPWVPTEDLVQV